MTLPVVAQAANGQVMAFAVYRPPADFVRSTSAGDASASSRWVQFQATENGTTGGNQLQLLRPPVVLVHGIWGSDATTWASFMPYLQKGSLATSAMGLTVTTACYDYPPLVPVSSSVPGYDPGFLATNTNGNALGFAYNAGVVLDGIYNSVNDFRQGKNTLNVSAAAAQADVISHSMGGLVARTLEELSTYAGPESFGMGDVHKLITIGTPHLGSPLAPLMIEDSDACVRGWFAKKNMISFYSVQMGGANVSGAIGDLQGDGMGNGMSPALSQIQAVNNQSGNAPVPTAMLAATTDAYNLSGLTSPRRGAFWFRSLLCPTDTLSVLMTPDLWPQVFGRAPSDGIVPLTSQLANPSAVLGTPDSPGTPDSSGSQPPTGIIHSGSLKTLGFKGPGETDSADIQMEIPSLLNESLNSSVFQPLP